MSSAYQLHNIRFHYAETLALSLPELFIQAHKTTALTGPNGSGKSTLLQLLAFITRPSQGEVHFQGAVVKTSDQLRLRKRVGFLSQKPYLLRGTVLDNIMLALKLRGINKLQRRQAMQALEALNIAHIALQPASALSGGELQKAALARILALQPEVLLLDEPFSYLDQISAQNFEQFISDYSRQPENTLIFSTHNRLQGYALANDIISLIDGESVKSPLINLFHGNLRNHRFYTGSLEIILPDDHLTGKHIAIDPHEIVISKHPLHSSMRNCFAGRIITIAEEMGKVRICIACGERFQALITYQALNDLELRLGDQAWINFKANSVVIV